MSHGECRHCCCRTYVFSVAKISPRAIPQIVYFFFYRFISLHIHFISSCRSCLAEFRAVILCDDGEYFVSSSVVLLQVFVSTEHSLHVSVFKNLPQTWPVHAAISTADK